MTQEIKKTIAILLGLLFVVFVSNCSNNLDKPKFNSEQLDSLKMIECNLIMKKIKDQKIDTIGRINYIPQTLSECLDQLDSILNPLQKDWIKCLPDKKFAALAHHELGMNLRNNWGLWVGSKLFINLYLMGIFHPDDMSSIILTSYQRHLKGENLKTEEQLKYYQDYWRKTGMPVDSLLHVFDSIRPKVAGE